jgi:hypothetical protein
VAIVAFDRLLDLAEFVETIVSHYRLKEGAKDK